MCLDQRRAEVILGGKHKLQYVATRYLPVVMKDISFTVQSPVVVFVKRPVPCRRRTLGP